MEKRVFLDGWLPLLSGVNGASPWAETAAQGASLRALLGLTLRCCSLRGVCLVNSMQMMPLYDYLIVPMFELMVLFVWIWYLVPFPLVLGFYAHLTSQAQGHRRWRHLDDDHSTGRMINSCGSFSSVLGPLQTVQRAELWGGSSCPAGF